MSPALTDSSTDTLPSIDMQEPYAENSCKGEAWAKIVAPPEVVHYSGGAKCLLWFF